jgi:lipid A 3-O-deacylase
MNRYLESKTFFVTLVLACTRLVSFAQAIDYSLVYRSLVTDRSFRFSYENDFFSASDRDYTQGVYIELIHPSLKKFLFSRLTWKTPAARRIFGIAIETDGYTPNNIDKPGIQYQDRPYASTLMFRAFNTATRPASRERVTNTITIGVLGPWAEGKEIQTSIHRWIGYTTPQGWHNQVHNEPILNYQLNYEKGLLGNNKNFLLTALGAVRAGTLSTKAVAGTTVMIGNFANPYGDTKPHDKKLNYHFYDHASVNLVGHDATLQGGLFNRQSPYVIEDNQLNRFVFQNRFGLVLSYRKLIFEYWQSFMTKEYKTGIEPKTGGLQIGVKI